MSILRKSSTKPRLRTCSEGLCKLALAPTLGEGTADFSARPSKPAEVIR